MRRGVQIAVSVLVVLLLLKPFDCFSSRKFTKEAAECCKKGKCHPSTGDDCCKGTLPGGNDMVTGAKAQPHELPVALPVSMSALSMEPVVQLATFMETSDPPGSPPSSRLNLPLLI
jgi:hypothetical protein